MDWLLHQPLTGSGSLVYAEGLDLRMPEEVDDGGEPLLPVMTAAPPTAFSGDLSPEAGVIA
jgi:hypothetical protein